MLGLAGCASLLSWDEPPRKRTKPRTVTAAAPAKTPQTIRSVSPRTAIAGEYTVRPGDTLYSIAFRHQLDFRELAHLNGIDSDYRISVGQTLKLRGSPVQKEIAKAIAKPAITESTATKFDWLWPTTGKIDKEYAPQSGFKGLDFTGNLGQPVFAAAPGRVVYSGSALKGYGELIIIKHSDVFLSAYGYNRKRHVSEGDVVTAGQPIGELGLGPENKPLLHFEIREHGQPINPANYLPKRETVPGVVSKN
jgi:lipoprotein NlpD